jgi:hypothetical protein
LPRVRPSPLSAAALPRPPTLRTTDTVFARATLTMNLGIIWKPCPPKWAGRPARGRDRRRGVSTEREQWRIRVCERPVGAASDRLVPTTTEHCSDRESVLGRSRLGERTSRCSHDLFPLRGLPIQPLGLRPPLMCLLFRESRRLTARWPVVLRHFRVSIRPDLGATPKSGSSLLGVCNLFRSLRALQQSRANL